MATSEDNKFVFEQFLTTQRSKIRCKNSFDDGNNAILF